MGWELPRGGLWGDAILEQKLHHFLFYGAFGELSHSGFKGLNSLLRKAVGGWMVWNRRYVFGFDKASKFFA